MDYVILFVVGCFLVFMVISVGDSGSVKLELRCDGGNQQVLWEFEDGSAKWVSLDGVKCKVEVDDNL